jgi:hypothetical protein
MTDNDTAPGIGTLIRGVCGSNRLNSSWLWCLPALYFPIVVAWLAAMIWSRGMRADESMRLRPDPAMSFSNDATTLTVYVAAHNEESRIGACLQRLLSQNYPAYRVVVVNDRSGDGTADVVREAMKTDSRVALVEIEQLPPGWVGKTHALAVATRGESSDYLLFVDCDCRLAPGAIASMMRKVIDERLDFVSLWPMLDLKSPSERLITPAVSWLLGLHAIVASKSTGDGSQVVLGNGQFMLFSRGAYEQVGGHASVQDELAEDAILAKKIDDAGLRHWVGWGKGVYLSTRDNSFAGTANATTRVVIGSFVKPVRVFAGIHLLTGGVGMPVQLGVPAAIALLWRSDLLQLWGVIACAGVHLLAMRFTIKRLFEMTFLKCPSVLSFSIGGMVAGFVLMRAFCVTIGLGTVRWGRTAYGVRGSRITTASTR